MPKADLLGQDSGIYSESWPFANDPDTLAIGGVQLTSDQLTLFRDCRDEGIKALAVAAVIVQDVRSPRHPCPVLVVHSDSGALLPLVVPTVVELDWDHWPVLDDVEPGWRLFPSLPGRGYRYCGSDWGFELGEVKPFRLWDLLPVDPEEAHDLTDAMTLWHEHHLEPYFHYVEYTDGHLERACEMTGTPPSTHSHVHDPLHGRFSHCEDGEAWAESYRFGCLTLGPDEELYPIEFPQPRPRFLTAEWQELYDSSRRTFQAALACYPEREISGVLAYERMYSPWSWL